MCPLLKSLQESRMYTEKNRLLTEILHSLNKLKLKNLLSEAKNRSEIWHEVVEQIALVFCTGSARSRGHCPSQINNIYHHWGLSTMFSIR